MTVQVKVRFDFTDAPAWLSNVEFERDEDDIVITTWKRNGNVQADLRTPADEFFKAIDLLRKE